MHLFVTRFCHVSQAGLEFILLPQYSKSCNYQIRPALDLCQSITASLRSVSGHIQVLANSLCLGERPWSLMLCPACFHPSSHITGHSESFSLLQEGRFQFLGEFIAQIRCCQTLQYQLSSEGSPGIGMSSSCLFRSFCEPREATACPRRLIWRAVVRKPSHLMMKHALAKGSHITQAQNPPRQCHLSYLCS